ncbi:MAG: SURF1 family protein [Steroidobacteraceae bacterium]
MPVRFRNRVFAPSLTGTALTVLVLAGLTNLGLWQLRRAEEKRELLAAYEAGQGTIIPLAAGSAGDLPRYQQVTASGKYESDRQLLLDNMPSKSGAPGFRVMTPFRLDGGSGLVLVDRGWIPVGPDRSVLPGIDVDEAHREIRAMLDELPRPGVRLGAADDAAGTWPRVVNFPEHEELVAMYGEPLLQPVMLLDPAEDAGYERAWEARFGFGPERHVGYAVQWFSLSAALLVLYFVASLRPANRELN